MKSIVCTLFEGHYHLGVAALVNSLYANNFRGDFFAGYKGNLPDWAINLSNYNSEQWSGGKTMHVTNDLNIHFLPLSTDWHLAYYKPDFMQKLVAEFPENAVNIFYFDPDIVIKCPWTFFERWITHGVAVVHEMITATMPSTHPIRKEWEKVILKSNYSVQRQIYAGINSGFCGVSHQNLDFLTIWSQIILSAIKFYKINPQDFAQTDDIYLFHMADQDAMNMAAMCCECPISEMGPDAMEFTYGGWKIMSHSTGSPKPWKKKYIISALMGIQPTLADKSYWLNSQKPLKTYNTLTVKRKKISLSLAGLIGRFYRKY